MKGQSELIFELDMWLTSILRPNRQARIVSATKSTNMDAKNG